MAGWGALPPRRLAALAIRRATEERVERAAEEVALRLGVLADGFEGRVAEAGADLLRVADLPRVAAALDFVPVVAIGLALLAGLALVAGRLVRAFGAALVKSAESVAGALAPAAAGLRRERAELTALAFAAARGLAARAPEVDGVARVR